jgi:hypothetical protein
MLIIQRSAFVPLSPNAGSGRLRVSVLEFSLSVPLYKVEDGGSLKSVPRSGGEKNYVRNTCSSIS